ncbi:MAG: nuclear transport factor 2 family protein [Chloroflexota bacterium]|nr:nuclear transport factor 2 family protein [Chloroflexota bacterium]
MSDKFRALYERQLEILAAKDHNRVVDENYAPDAELRNFDSHVVGTEALKKFFEGYIAALGSIEVLSTDKYVEGSDSMLFEAHIQTAHGIAHVYDVFVLKNEKIWRHFGGVISFTPNPAS